MCHTWGTYNTIPAHWTHMNQQSVCIVPSCERLSPFQDYLLSHVAAFPLVTFAMLAKVQFDEDFKAEVNILWLILRLKYLPTVLETCRTLSVWLVSLVFSFKILDSTSPSLPKINSFPINSLTKFVSDHLCAMGLINS